jgi:hypothetical protein
MRVLELLQNEDHERLTCQARYAACSCGYEQRIIDAAKEDAAEITRLRAENAALRAAGQAVLNAWFVGQIELMEAVIALRAVLKEGGGE